MPRKQSRPASAPSTPMQRFVWNMHSGSDLSQLVDWDLKPELVVGALLEVAAAGHKLQWKAVPWRSEVQVAIFGEADGDRKYFAARDSVELDEVFETIYMVYRQARLGEVPQSAAAD